MSDKLPKRARVALLWLDETTDPRSPEGPSYAVPKRNAFAFNLADIFRRTGQRRPSNRGYSGEVNGAANTLVALKRRGLAENDGGGAWLQARWWITTEGRALAKELRMTHVVDEMPTLRQVEDATPEQVVEWHIYLRPTMMQEELHTVKAIARRYEALPPSVREPIQLELRRRHG